MQELLGRTGRIIVSGLAVVSVAVILFFVGLTSETQTERERLEDPVSLVFVILMLVFAASLWKVKYKRWQAMAIFTLIWLLLYGINIIFNVTM